RDDEQKFGKAKSTRAHGSTALGGSTTTRPHKHDRLLALVYADACTFKELRVDVQLRARGGGDGRVAEPHYVGTSTAAQLDSSNRVPRIARTRLVEQRKWPPVGAERRYV